jgi:hypothetical protein
VDNPIVINNSWRADPVDGITGREDQKRSRDTDIADRERAYELAKPTIERWQEMPNREAYVQSMIASAAYVAYRAGREDLLRSGSCPECAAGDPHNEPDKPHIHLTTYGYLLYAPDHEQLDFVREIREIERRAGREDAAREERAKIADELDHWAARLRGQPFRSGEVGFEYIQGIEAAAEFIARDADQSGPGVQPTEEQRAREEDQKRDEKGRL